MLNQEIKQNPLWEKNQNFYIIYKAQRLYWWALMLVCLCICVIWYWCIPVVCADMVPEESQCNCCCKCACSVSAAPLDSRIYVMCGLCSVMFQSLFFVCFCTILSVHPVPQLQGFLGGWDVIQPRPPWLNPVLRLWRRGRRAGLLVPLVRRPLRKPPQEFQAEVGDDIWAKRAFLSSSSSESMWSNPKRDYFQHRWDWRLINL